MAEKKFGTDTYRTEPLDAEQGLRLLIRTTKILGPASPIMAALSDADPAKAEAQSLAAVAEFAAKLNEDDAIDYLKGLIALCRCNGEPAVFGVTPASIQDVFAIAFWVLEVNFRDFLGGSGPKGLISRATAKAA